MACVRLVEVNRPRSHKAAVTQSWSSHGRSLISAALASGSGSIRRRRLDASQPESSRLC
jgi:hypothetical protein